MKTSEHPACTAAKAKAAVDFPGHDVYHARVLAEEPERFLVVATFWRLPLRMMPVSMQLYSVSADGALARSVPASEGEQYGLLPSLRK